MRTTPTAFRADGLSRLRHVHAALVVAQDQQIAARIDFLVDAGAIAVSLRAQPVLEARHRGIAGRPGKLVGKRVLAPFIGSGYVRQAEFPSRRTRLDTMVAAGP